MPKSAPQIAGVEGRSSLDMFWNRMEWKPSGMGLPALNLPVMTVARVVREEGTHSTKTSEVAELAKPIIMRSKEMKETLTSALRAREVEASRAEPAVAAILGSLVGLGAARCAGAEDGSGLGALEDQTGDGGRGGTDAGICGLRDQGKETSRSDLHKGNGGDGGGLAKGNHF
ncbi:hypothetical protein PFICI_12921 [Pestalotiopsis fici W106-1]|uniref:Uncharacterized protein n=1 Tax=Pestalotiopsis fici (strain W106-1 / CGMCC3.15140) TaxID=1229662 RepID=W3WS38_PESFW|nr:uncharacterized protein PFICI_12921 [Pestalotiopsis fici W106-1]ETS75977.1 hypothetical protein PFICI_12921 [Pestalotiopsis fici W106-1]